jgi:signal transduction histidine kinase/DNA-binding response OmpR family regulator
LSPNATTAELPLPSARPDARPVRVLHLGRHPTDVERARHHLHGHGARFVVDGTLTLDECLGRLLTEPFDALLLDERASDCPALEALRALRARRLRIPVVLLLRKGDELPAFELTKVGVYDYLVKRAGDLAKLPLILDNAAEHYRLREEREQFAVLGRFLTATSGRPDLGDVLEAVLRAAHDLLGSDRNVVLLLENGETLVPRACTGFAPAALAELRLPAETGVWSEVLAAGVPRRLEAVTLAGPWGLPLAGLEWRLAIPLVARERRVGLLLAGSAESRHLPRFDEAALRALAESAAAAVENARLLEQLLHVERLSTVGRMVAGVAHELNNPLAVITGTLDLVRQDAADRRLGERLALVAAQAQRAVKIVRTLLALARKRPPQRRPVDVDELLTGTLELATYDLRHAGVRVIREEEAGLPPVLADPDQLQQVFANLVLNAAQAMREARASGTLSVTTALDPAAARVRVTLGDDGPGIKPEHLPHVFEPFFTTKGEGQGTGLGLAICQRIVENHGGRIGVTSGPGGGARFTVELPAAGPGLGEEAAPRPEAVAPGDAMDVLLVEDEPLVGDMLAEILALDGYRVDRASNGREALARLRTRAYGVVVSDVRMPDLNGPALYQELRRLDPPLARRVIFVTGDVMNPDTRDFLDQTGVLYLEKPFGPQDLSALIRRALSA